jgi:hypothetical protein
VAPQNRPERQCPVANGTPFPVYALRFHSLFSLSSHFRVIRERFTVPHIFSVLSGVGGNCRLSVELLQLSGIINHREVADGHFAPWTAWHEEERTFRRV